MTLWYGTVFAKKNNPRSICVDFDGTIAKEVEYPDIGSPNEGVKEALGRLMDAGYEVTIFTCRMNRDGRNRSEIEKQRKAVEDWMAKHEMPYSKIDDGVNGKPFCDYFIDNKNIEYHGGDDWPKIADLILSKR